MDDETVSDEEMAEALEHIQAGTADFHHVEAFVFGAEERDNATSPACLYLAFAAYSVILPDLRNGGMDQVVWNHGAEVSREFADALDAVGAIENAELISSLADAVEEYQPVDPEHVSLMFHAFRTQMGGPFFGVPNLWRELEEAVLEWALEHPEQFDYSG